MIKPSQAGFEAITRQWNESQSKVIARVDPGQFYMTSQDELIYTRLGSCVSACIWDPKLGIGGLNHFLLPERGSHNAWQQLDSYSCRYGYWAMEQLINAIQQAGGERGRLKAKLFGGAKMYQGTVLAIGESNIKFVRHYLETEAIEVLSEDLGGTWPRKILFHPNSGRVRVKRLSVEPSQTLLNQETNYLEQLADVPTKQNIELFD